MSDRFLSPDGCFQLSRSSKEEIRSSFRQLVERVNRTLERLELVSKPNWNNLIVPFYETQSSIDQFGNRVLGIYVYSISNPDYQEVYCEIYADFAELETKLISSANFMTKVAELREMTEYNSYDLDQKNYLQSLLNKAATQGTLMDEGLKKSIADLQREISTWAQVFNSNVQKSTEEAGITVHDVADLGPMPRRWIVEASEDYNRKFNPQPLARSTHDSGPWLISLTSGVYAPFMEYSENRALKKEIYSQKRQVASSGPLDNNEAIHQLLIKRKQLAQLRGFENFLESSLEFTTARAAQLEQLATMLADPFKKKQSERHDIYRGMARADGLPDLQPWDIARYERQHKESLGFDQEEIARYFPYTETKKALFKLVEDCFSIRIIEATGDVDSWHADVEFYRVSDADGTDLGGFYIDPYQRSGEKIVGTQNVGAFCVTLRESQLIDQKNIRPIGMLSYGFAPPSADAPSLCQPVDIASFLHEFGHLLAVLLKQQSAKTISPAFYLEIDSVEFESMILECWAHVPYILKRVSKHVKTGEPLSDAQVEMLKKFLQDESSERGHGLLAITQVSLALYSTFDPARDDLKTTVDRIMRQVYASPYFDHDRFVWGCTPLFTLNGYLANTYMYLWAMTVAHTYLANIENTGWNDLSVQKLGQTLKQTLYRHAAVGRPMHALKLATGRDAPDFAGFAQKLISVP